MIAIYMENRTARAEYICHQLFKHILGCRFTIVSKEEEYLKASCPAICYARDYAGKGLHIVPHGLLAETGIRPLEPHISYWHELPVFFQTGGREIPFDLLAAAFYLLSRYEEYIEKSVDIHGRYPVEKSLAFRHGFLLQPIVDQWAVKLRKILQAHYPELSFETPHFQFIPSIDVDNVFAFRHKGLLINGYHLLRDLFTGKIPKVTYRLSVILRRREDPFFNLGKVALLHQECGTFPVFFFHCGCYGKFDKKTILPSYSYRKAKQNISRDFLVGLHPSYRAAFSPFIFRLEGKALEGCTLDKRIYHNRFHYLRFRLPESYRMLSHAHIAHDWSMGYASHSGFRAGTSFPFHFYNIENEKTYKLMIHPFAVMDKTLKSDLKLSREESVSYVLELAQKVKEVNGVFVSIFHNENLTDAFSWKGWRDTYYSLLKELSRI